ncbi:TPA: hypothetical protein ACTUNV_002608 [Legionella pneumophila]
MGITIKLTHKIGTIPQGQTSHDLSGIRLEDYKIDEISKVFKNQIPDSVTELKLGPAIFQGKTKSELAKLLEEILPKQIETVILGDETINIKSLREKSILGDSMFSQFKKKGGDVHPTFNDPETKPKF